jgi:DNA-binding MarR family transcriptional regulator
MPRLQNRIFGTPLLGAKKETRVTKAPRLDEAIVTSLRRIIRAIDLHSRDLLQSFGLTAPQLMSLQELARLGPVPVGVLSKAVHVSQATMTGILDRLEQQSLVQRTRDGVDRRSVTISITVEGTDLLKQAPSLLQDHFRERLAGLKPAEQMSILKALQQIAEMMGAADLSAAPILVSGPEALASAKAGPRKRLAAAAATADQQPRSKARSSRLR